MTNEKVAKKGQGFNDARGEIEDKKDIPRQNGLNVNNDPQRLQEKKGSQKVNKKTL